MIALKPMLNIHTIWPSPCQAKSQIWKMAGERVFNVSLSAMGTAREGTLHISGGALKKDIL
jgi:hypothetical protein